MGFWQSLFYGFWSNFKKIWSGWNLIWHALAIILTYALVISGFDWFYWMHTRNVLIFPLFFPAAFLGLFVPIIIPILLIFVWNKNKSILNLGYALAQAGIIAWLVSAIYKAFTGRSHPTGWFSSLGPANDITGVFKFGFLRGGIFWGWPSSHAIVAFATAVVFIILIKNSKLRIFAVLYALYIGIGVSLTIHWFSDFVAGAILGILVGIIVGRSFKEKSSILKRI